MTRIRTTRRAYYNLFSYFYDAFIRLHARRDAGDTRNFLVKTARLDKKPDSCVLDICCGTGAVIEAFAANFPRSTIFGYDFSHGMLLKARGKTSGRSIILIEGDAAALPFVDESFDVITCSHALYELKGPARQNALKEMRRVIRADGITLIMEHEVPRHPLIRRLFNIRMLAMGSVDAREFVEAGMEPFKKIFSTVTRHHTPSGKSKLFVCRR
jgi:ubiquinone/menaquinone biosynthesis C-methylase UbiE